ncbi:MAG: ChrR family anti-sigma-E factor, partial [Pseudomonadota bacterium]|nr:ChrR family anti-sigma-E factor [Pseudomonadota bacterium]
DLDDAFLVVVATHLAMCDHCRAAVRAAEELGGELLEEADAASLAPSSFDALMRKLDSTADGEGGEIRPDTLPRSGADVPAPLSRRIGDRLEDVRWRTVAPGVRKHVIETARGTPSALYMLWIAPGKAVPEHGHGGSELTLILSGAYRDSLGVFGPGDIADLDEHVEHQPRVEDGAPCICLVATERPTRFKGLISRLLQPLVGI